MDENQSMDKDIKMQEKLVENALSIMGAPGLKTFKPLNCFFLPYIGFYSLVGNSPLTSAIGPFNWCLTA
jgi:hypothetical protein